MSKFCTCHGLYFIVFCRVHFLVDILNIRTFTVCLTQNSYNISEDEKTKRKKRLILSCSLFAIFFPGMRNDVLLVIQDLGSRSVTSDFHARSQTIPCEICDRCHRERFCARNILLLSRTHPSTNTRYALIHPPTTLYKHNNWQRRYTILPSLPLASKSWHPCLCFRKRISSYSYFKASLYLKTKTEIILLSN